MVAIAAILPHPVRPAETFSPHSVSALREAKCMASTNTKIVLWANVQALMLHHWGKENLSELSRRAKVGLATCDRIKKRETSVGLDVTQQIAEVFGLEAWHLLTPGLDPKNPPKIWLTQTEFDLYDDLRNTAKKLIDASH